MCLLHFESVECSCYLSCSSLCLWHLDCISNLHLRWSYLIALVSLRTSIAVRACVYCTLNQQGVLLLFMLLVFVLVAPWLHQQSSFTLVVSDCSCVFQIFILLIFLSLFVLVHVALLTQRFIFRCSSLCVLHIFDYISNLDFRVAYDVRSLGLFTRAVHI